MPCVSSTSSFRLRIRNPPAVRATPVDERDWLSSRIVNGFDDDELCVHTSQSEGIILLDETSSRSGWHPRHPGRHQRRSQSRHGFHRMIPPRTSSVDLASHHHKRTSKSHSRNSQLSFVMHVATVTLGSTRFTSFHTPASSFSDGTHSEPVESALSSPLSRSRSSSSLLLHAHIGSRTTRRHSLSSSTISISIAPMITPARYATEPCHLVPREDPSLFFTLAKAGAGVSDVFAYIA
ncbi:hypothetical protein BGW80DRAFT_1563394 [Lactifluus volemus]|nr:hypothetical protein BGW80DRAFT_1563394 [Lactifluus volemus]